MSFKLLKYFGVLWSFLILKHVFLLEHLNTKADCSKDESVPTLICEQCPKPQVFYNAKKFEAHRLRHQAVHKCEDCGQMLDDYKKYIKHLRIVHKKSNKQHTCTHCTKSFVQKENLDRDFGELW